jgi:N-acetylneuraminic acid mutarotase
MQKRTELYSALCFWDRIEEADEENIPCERYKHSSVYLPEQRAMYTFGGSDFENITLNEVWRFDLDTNSWSFIQTTGEKPCRRCECACILFSERRGDEHHAEMIIFGGFTGQIRLNDMYSLDLYTHQFTRIEYTLEGTQNITPRSGMVAVNVDNQYMYIFGGNDERPSNELWKMDLRTHVMHAEYVFSPTDYVPRGIEPEPRYWHDMVYYPRDHCIYIFGGSNGSGSSQLRDLITYDTRKKLWNEIHDQNLGFWPQSRFQHSLNILNDRLYLYGGFSYTMDHLPNIHEFDLLSHYWLGLQSRPLRNFLHYEDMMYKEELPEARKGHTCCVISEDELLVFAGKNFNIFDDLFRCRLPPMCKVKRSSNMLFHLVDNGNYFDVNVIV